MRVLVRFCHTLVLSIVMALGTIVLGEAISNDLHIPGARIVVAECQGFEALATAGGTSSPDCARSGERDPHAGEVVVDAPAAVAVHAKA